MAESQMAEGFLAEKYMAGKQDFPYMTDAGYGRFSDSIAFFWYFFSYNYYKFETI